MVARLAILLAAIVGSAMSARAHAPRSYEQLHGRTMGTSFAITLERPESLSLDVLDSACRAELERIEQIFSLYRGDSELSRLNAARPNEWQAVSRDLARVAARALELSTLTGGAFDPTLGPLMRVWKLREVSADWEPPTQDVIDAARESVGARWVEVRLNPPAVLKLRDRVELDLNALVEGWAIDRLIERLRAHGVANALVELGGEFRGIGRRTDGQPWRIGLEDPHDPSRLYGRVTLDDAAISTSGDYRQASVVDGVRYSHIVDPRTGTPIRHDGAAVSVLADDAFTADGWATALLVLGPEEGFRLAEARRLAASFVGRLHDPSPRLTTAARRNFEMLNDHSPSSAWHPNWLWPIFPVAVLAIFWFLRCRESQRSIRARSAATSVSERATEAIPTGCQIRSASASVSSGSPPRSSPVS
jgi:FAD:protein FMN transferase